MTPLQALHAERRRRFWLDPPRRVRSLRGAARFLDDVGVAFVFGQPRTLVPSLLDAHSGGRAEMGWNEETGHVWDWKDKLAETRQAAFGRFFRAKASFIAPRMIAAFYASGVNYGGLDDVEEAFHAGRVGPVARRIGAMLAARGPMSTARLRRNLHLERSAGGSAFHRGMQDLYETFKITNVGINTEETRWPAAVVDLLPRAFPAEAGAGARVTLADARDDVLRCYLRAVVACTPQQAERVLRWGVRDVRAAFERLSARGEAVTWSPGRVAAGTYAEPEFVARLESGDGAPRVSKDA